MYVFGEKGIERKRRRETKNSRLTKFTSFSLVFHPFLRVDAFAKRKGCYAICQCLCLRILRWSIQTFCFRRLHVCESFFFRSKERNIFVLFAGIVSILNNRTSFFLFHCILSLFFYFHSPLYHIDEKRLGCVLFSVVYIILSLIIQ